MLVVVDMTEKLAKKRVVSITVNNNNHSGSGLNAGQSQITVAKARTTTNSLSVSSRAKNRTEVPPPNPTATALLQAYLTLNNLTRTSGDNSKHNRSTVSNTTVAVSKSAATKSFSDV